MKNDFIVIYLLYKFHAKVYYSSKISLCPYLTIKDLWVSVAIRTTTENGKYKIKRKVAPW